MHVYKSSIKLGLLAQTPADSGLECMTSLVCRSLSQEPQCGMQVLDADCAVSRSLVWRYLKIFKSLLRHRNAVYL